MLYSQSLVLNCARLPIDAMYNNFIMDRIHARNYRPCLAQYGRGGRGGGTISNGKEGGGRTLSLMFNLPQSLFKDGHP